jgi:hypothetical protein
LAFAAGASSGSSMMEPAFLPDWPPFFRCAM